MIKSKQIFWGWWVVFGAFVIMFVTYGVRYAFGVFVKPMFIEYGWPMTIISLAATINLLIYAATGILTGWLLDKIPPKWIMTMGFVITALGLLSASFVRTPLGLYLSYGLLCGIGAAGSGVVACNAVIGKWFVKRRGLALGIATMGIGVGTLVMAPLAGYIVEKFDWRAGFLFIAAITLVVGCMVSQVLMGKSGRGGQVVLPGADKPEEDPPDFNHDTGYAGGVALKQVVIDSRFWLLVICYTVAIMTVMMTFVHQIAYAVNNGINKVEAAASLGVIGLTGGLGKFFFGWLSDRLKDAKYSAALGFFVMSAGMFLLYRTRTETMLVLYALIFGFGYGSLGPMMPYLISDRFGPRSLGTAYGLLIFFATGIGGGIGPLLGGILFDKMGSYAIGWLINTILLLLSFLLILLLKPSKASGSEDPEHSRLKSTKRI